MNAWKEIKYQTNENNKKVSNDFLLETILNTKVLITKRQI